MRTKSQNKYQTDCALYFEKGLETTFRVLKNKVLLSVDKQKLKHSYLNFKKVSLDIVAYILKDYLFPKYTCHKNPDVIRNIKIQNVYVNKTMK